MMVVRKTRVSRQDTAARCRTPPEQRNQPDPAPGTPACRGRSRGSRDLRQPSRLDGVDPHRRTPCNSPAALARLSASMSRLSDARTASKLPTVRRDRRSDFRVPPARHPDRAGNRRGGSSGHDPCPTVRGSSGCFRRGRLSSGQAPVRPASTACRGPRQPRSTAPSAICPGCRTGKRRAAREGRVEHSTDLHPRTTGSPCHDHLPERHARLRPQPARPEMARRRAHRAPVRRQLRGGRGELRAARRRGVGGVPLRDRRGATPARRAPHEHGVDLRVRLPGRVLAAVADIHAPRDASHRLRGGDGARTQPRGGGGDAGSGLGDREPRSALESTTSSCRWTSNARISRRPSRSTPG